MVSIERINNRFSRDKIKERVGTTLTLVSLNVGTFRVHRTDKDAKTFIRQNEDICKLWHSSQINIETQRTCWYFDD